MAHGIMKNEDKQQEDLIAASKLVPEDTLISGEIAKITQRKREHREREKKAYAKLFS
jgi:peptidyl-prolyl isomerase D